MMWKESYKLGNELIDAQHKELFDRTEHLLAIVRSEDAAAKNRECIDAILFLKNYAVEHFATEEAFQESINYCNRKLHKIIHSSFIGSIFEAEAELIAKRFSPESVKNFCGFLTMWLIYHVAGADRKIVSGDGLSDAEFAVILSHEESYKQSMEDVLDTMFGESVVEQEAFTGSAVTSEGSDEIIELDIILKGSRKGNAIFTVTKETALNLINTLTNLDLTETDALTYSALSQIASLIIENAVEFQDENETNCFELNTKFGRISITVRT